MSKKILIVTDNTPDQINGVVTTFNNIVKYGVEEGYQFYFCDPSKFPHIAAPGYPEVKLSYPKGLPELFKLVKPDHIHIATEGPLGFAARLYCDFKGYKYNTSYHSRFPEMFKEIYKVPEWISYAYLRWFHKHSGIVLTNTDTMVTLLKRKKFKSNIVKWTRGVDNVKLSPTIPNEQDGTVLYVGRVSKEKNLDALCELQEKFPIVIVGDGPYRSALEKKYSKVKFVGYKSGSDLANYYRKASVFCFPSKADTFGLVIIEAMSLGCPVAAYPVTGPVDIIENHVTGVMSLDLEEAINECFLLSRSLVERKSKDWNWKNCWNVFKENLINV
jgi:glycosyltransferase involved in cell wall biosynthesis